MKKKRILLLGGNFSPEPTGIGKYNGEMMDWLSTNGYECSVITTYPYYPFWKVQPPYNTKSFWYKKEKKYIDDTTINIYRCPHYIPKMPSGKKRILSDFSFFLSAFFRLFLLMFQKKYEYVITVAPPFQLGLLGFLYKKVKGAKLIYHIQDLQIDAAHELGMIRSKALVRLMFGIEKFILKKADYVSSISEGMIKKIKTKYDIPVILFPNWVDTRSFYPIFQKEEIRQEFNFSPTDKIILYSGAIGEKQGLQTLLHSAKNLNNRTDIKFIICGSGPYKEKLIKLAESMDLQNIHFMPLQPKEKFNQFLNMADVHLVLQKANTNDLVMPSKLTAILAVGGLAIVTTEPETSLYAEIATHKMGILAEPESHDALTASILMAIQHPHTTIKENAREFAENYLTIDKIVYKFFLQIIQESKNQPLTRKLNTQIQIDATI